MTHKANWQADRDGWYILICQDCGKTFGESAIPDLSGKIIAIAGKCNTPPALSVTISEEIVTKDKSGG